MYKFLNCLAIVMVVFLIALPSYSCDFSVYVKSKIQLNGGQTVRIWDINPKILRKCVKKKKLNYTDEYNRLINLRNETNIEEMKKIESSY